MQTQRYIKTARADGMGWHELGALLGVGPDAIEDGVSVAEAAFSFAAGRPASSWEELMVWWTCPACGETISDRGPGFEYPGDAEQGHAEDCKRLAAAITEHDALWTQDALRAELARARADSGPAPTAGGDAGGTRRFRRRIEPGT
jgi:hypothetical protein